jgi:hypothetical protein
MGLQCISEDAILRPPVKLDFSNTSQVTKPFVLNGSPMSNRPTSLSNSGEFRRKEKALKNPKTPKYYNDDNYYTVNLNTQNIIGPDSFGNTTLRFEEQTYTLAYAAIHATVWEILPGPQLSMVFTTPNLAILHICIPIQLTNTDLNVNSFLAHWLYDETAMPPGFTMNETMNFNQPIVSFASLQYCLKYNNGEKVSPYTFFVFKTPLNVNVSKCPDWITKLSNPEKVPAEGASQTYMRKSFDEIFNLMLHGQLNYFMRDVKDPRLISVESHFSDDRTQTYVKPIFYTVKQGDLYKKKSSEGFVNQFPLQNVKCYPINLHTQIDDNGSIMIDQETNKPIDIQSVGSNMYKTIDPTLAMNAQDANVIAQNNVRYYVVLGVLGFIVFMICIVLLIFSLRGKSFIDNVAAVGAAGLTGTAMQFNIQAATTKAENAARTKANASSPVPTAPAVPATPAPPPSL